MPFSTPHETIKIDMLLPILRDLRDMLYPDSFEESREVVSAKRPAYERVKLMIAELEAIQTGNYVIVEPEK